MAPTRLTFAGRRSPLATRIGVVMFEEEPAGTTNAGLKFKVEAVDHNYNNLKLAGSGTQGIHYPTIILLCVD